MPTNFGCWWSNHQQIDSWRIWYVFILIIGLRFGVTSDEAENGQIAVQMYKKVRLLLTYKSWQRTCCGPYKIILMDLNMPVMDGIRATQRILGDWKGSQKPNIIAVTAFSSNEEIKKWKRAGMWDFKNKPIDSDWYKDLLIRYGKTNT